MKKTAIFAIAAISAVAAWGLWQRSTCACEEPEAPTRTVTGKPTVKAAALKKAVAPKAEIKKTEVKTDITFRLQLLASPELVDTTSAKWKQVAKLEIIKEGNYMPPLAPGYSITMKNSSIETFTFSEQELVVKRYRKNSSEQVYMEGLPVKKKSTLEGEVEK